MTTRSDATAELSAVPTSTVSPESDIAERPRLLSGPPNPINSSQPLLPFRSLLQPAWAHHLQPGLLHEVTVGETHLSIHPELPPIATWGYGLLGQVSTPGPQLEAQVDQLSLLRFHNRIPVSAGVAGTGKLPFLVARRDAEDPDDSTQNYLGTDATTPVDTSSSPVGWTSVHLHGGHSRPDSDGFPDNMNRSGRSQVVAYDNTYDNTDLGLGKVGAFLWYHDHAMNSTRYHVYSGLAGAYIVRDPREALLGLPTGIDAGELTLLIQDRNLGLDDDDSLRFLHKTTADTAEFFGPLTLVNGKLWPRLPLRANVYRMRLLNGSNARAYRLHLVSFDAGSVTVEHERVLVIGTDGGLLWRAAPLTAASALTLAPAERIDILVDLTGLPPGAQLFLVNSAEAPFGGSPVPTADELERLLTSGDDSNRIPFPAVLRIDVDFASPVIGKPQGLFTTIAKTELNPAFRRLVHDSAPPQTPGQPKPFPIEDHAHRVILLAENPAAGHLFLQEVTQEDTGPIPLQLPGDHAPKNYRVEDFLAVDTADSTTRVPFYDRIVLRPEIGQWQVWHFVNTTGDTHPMHIHQSMFQPLREQAFRLVVQSDPGTPQAKNFYNPLTRTTSAPLIQDLDPNNPPRAYDPHEKLGWKDVIRIDPGNIVSVAIRFDIPGRYVFHCHVLEHEDTEMMRPFVVTVKPMEDSDSMHM